MGERAWKHWVGAVKHVMPMYIYIYILYIIVYILYIYIIILYIIIMFIIIVYFIFIIITIIIIYIWKSSNKSWVDFPASHWRTDGMFPVTPVVETEQSLPCSKQSFWILLAGGFKF